MMVSTERIRSLSDWFNGVGALAVPGEELACEVKAALDELLAYREGYDPKEREPDLGQWATIEQAAERLALGAPRLEAGKTAVGQVGQEA